MSSPKQYPCWKTDLTSYFGYYVPSRNQKKSSQEKKFKQENFVDASYNPETKSLEVKLNSSNI
jgi:hypothetical protein